MNKLDIASAEYLQFVKDRFAALEATWRFLSTSRIACVATDSGETALSYSCQLEASTAYTQLVEAAEAAELEHL